MKSLAPEMGALTAGGIMANRWVSKKLKEATNLDRLNFAEEQIEDLKKDQFYSERPELLEERINEIREDATRERKWWDKGGFNDGGRVGMMYGGDPGFAFSYGGSWADWKENHASEMPVMDYINQKLPKARNPFSDSSYEEGGPVKPMTPEEFAQSIFQKPYNQLTSAQQQAINEFTSGKAEGGRVPMLRGGLLRTGIIEAFEHLTRRYGDDLGEWAGKLGDVRKFFTQIAPNKVDKILKSYGQDRKIDLSKGMKEFLNDRIKQYKSGLGDIKKYGQSGTIKEVGDHAEELKWLIRETKKDIKAIDQYGLLKQSQKATKHAEGGRIGLGSGTSPKIIENRKRNLYFDLGRDDFMNMFEYLQSGLSQNDYDGKYKKGGRVGFKKGGKGGIGDLMSEMYRLFEISPLLASPELMDLIQKVPFDKGGKVKKAEGGIIEDDEFREFLEDRKNRDKDNFQRDFFEDFKKWKKWKEGNIMEVKDGGRIWRPKSAPQLTTTIPPESGPMPHGLTYLTGDDIVQNIGYKHGRN